MAENTEKLAQWEIKFNDMIEKIGTKEALEIREELNRLLDETKQTTTDDEEAEALREKYLEEIKNLETRIQYLEEQKEYLQYQPRINEVSRKIKEHKNLIKTHKEEGNNDKKYLEEQKKIIRQLEEEKKGLEAETEPFKIIVNGLNRKIKILTNRLERAVYSGFGSLIKNRREELGLSLKQIELMTGISPSYINRIEKGERKAPSFAVIEQLAKALEMPVSKLIDVAEGNTPKEIPSLEELLLTSQFTINGKRVPKKAKEKMVEFIKKFREISWEPEEKYKDFIQLMGYFDYFKEIFSDKK